MLASHLTSVANAVVCLVGFFAAAQQRLVAAGWSLGAFYPVWSRPLAIGPPLTGTTYFYLSLAGYCLHASVLGAERAACGSTPDHVVLLQRFLLLLAAASACMVAYVPELAMVFLLLEVPSPFVALWHTLQDFRLNSIPLSQSAGMAVVFSILKCRVMTFGFSLVCAISHPDAWAKLTAGGQRFMTTFLCLPLLVSYGVHFAQLSHDVHRQLRDAKDSRGASQPRRASDVQV